MFGVTVEYAPVDERGRIDLDWLDDNLDSDVLIVSTISVNNEIGTVQDVEAISKATHKVGALLHSDCSQAPLAMNATNLIDQVDLLSLSGHKIYGPKGVGALFVNRSAQSQISPIIYGGGQQNNLRSGTVPTHLVVGMGQAVELLGEGANSERDHLRALRDSLFQRLYDSGIDVLMTTPSDVPSHPMNANIRFLGLRAQDILQSIQPHVAASTGSACTSGMPESSHVLRAIGMSEQAAGECIRFSVGRGTKERDIQEAANIISEAARKLWTANNKIGS